MLNYKPKVHLKIAVCNNGFNSVYVYDTVTWLIINNKYEKRETKTKRNGLFLEVQCLYLDNRILLPCNNSIRFGP